MIRIVSATGSLGTGYVQQWTSAGFRDREPCTVWEPNSIPLKAGIIKARLVGNHNGLPLMAVTLLCCVPPSSFSSRSLIVSSLSPTPVSSRVSVRPSVSPSSVSPPAPQWYCVELPWWCLDDVPL